MASKKAVEAALKLLAMNFAGDVTPEKAKLWMGALDDVDDESLAAAVSVVIKTHTGSFLPPVAVVREACGANSIELPDVEAVIKLIEELGSYNPTTGWSPPRVALVKQEIGGAVAEAYGYVATRLFAANDTTREIAAREFGQALNEAVVAGVPITEAQRLLASAEPKRIGGTNG